MENGALRVVGAQLRLLREPVRQRRRVVAPQARQQRREAQVGGAAAQQSAHVHGSRHARRVCAGPLEAACGYTIQVLITDDAVALQDC